MRPLFKILIRRGRSSRLQEPKKRRKANVPPGKRITAADINPQDNHDIPVNLEKQSSTLSVPTHKQHNPLRGIVGPSDECNSDHESIDKFLMLKVTKVCIHRN